MIKGVKIVNLKTHSDERGFFREIFRFSENYTNENISQLSHSLVEDGIIKSWHGHVHQSQWNYVVTGQVNVVLYDGRKDSRTYKEIMNFSVGDDMEPTAYFFPPGIFHGYKCTKGPMNIIYLTSGVYDLNDEIRKSDEDLELNIKWD